LQQIEPIVREELGMQAIEEDFNCDSITYNNLKDSIIPMTAKPNQTYDQGFNLQFEDTTPK
jgi:hypothetical protein